MGADGSSSSTQRTQKWGAKKSWGEAPGRVWSFSWRRLVCAGTAGWAGVAAPPKHRLPDMYCPRGLTAFLRTSNTFLGKGSHAFLLLLGPPPPSPACLLLPSHPAHWIAYIWDLRMGQRKKELCLFLNWDGTGGERRGRDRSLCRRLNLNIVAASLFSIQLMDF